MHGEFGDAYTAYDSYASYKEVVNPRLLYMYIRIRITLVNKLLN